MHTQYIRIYHVGYTYTYGNIVMHTAIAYMRILWCSRVQPPTFPVKVNYFRNSTKLQSIMFFHGMNRTPCKRTHNYMPKYIYLFLHSSILRNTQTVRIGRQTHAHRHSRI